MHNYEKKSPKWMPLILCLNLLAFFSVGGTLAYLFTSSDPVVNDFSPVIPGSSIDETFKDNIKSNVVVTNTGDVDSYIRAKVVITWQNAKKEDGTGGDMYPLAPVEGSDYTISFGRDLGWTEAADGFWYYSTSVASGNSTKALIKEAQPIQPCTDPNYTLHIEILSQAIQETPDTAVDVWDNAKVNVTGNNGTLTVSNLASTPQSE